MISGASANGFATVILMLLAAASFVTGAVCAWRFFWVDASSTRTDFIARCAMFAGLTALVAFAALYRFTL